ncbi:MAG TPA: hypothetical protein VHM00_13540 [Caldimonas sp.]|jgi:hypothetical protein|nr:hypothetical protein [Caldimonas sp.]HEX2542094.1 hypothetical protein [Caldimonas sp.]
MNRFISSLAGSALIGVAALLASPAFAASASAPAGKAAYTKERADCEAGRTAQDRATCLKEAGAAADERKRNRLDNSGSLPQNAAERCNALTGTEKSDCLARAKGTSTGNQKTTTSGSVGGGGVIKETTTTTTVGSPTIVIVPGGSAASGPTK